MSNFIKFVLALHVLPLLVFSWITLLGVKDFSSIQWLVAWLMAAASMTILSYPVMWCSEKDNDKK